MSRIEANSLVIVLDGTVKIAFLRVRPSTVFEGIGIPRLQSHCLNRGQKWRGRSCAGAGRKSICILSTLALIWPFNAWEGINRMDWNFVAENGPIPSVNPADLRSVCAVQRDIRSRFPGQRVLMVDDDDLKHACSPGADLFAIGYRIAMLEMLTELRLLSPWLHNGELDDAVFNVFATIPMKRIQKGGQEGFPFDVQELTKQIEKEANAEETQE
jgi:hypothetical protein